MLSYFFTLTKRDFELTAIESVLVATAIFNAFIAVIGDPDDLIAFTNAMLGLQTVAAGISA
jgi:hypothetical protein